MYLEVSAIALITIAKLLMTELRTISLRSSCNICESIEKINEP